MLQFYLALIESEEDKILFDEMYTENRAQMFKVAYAILKSHHRAEEAVHDAFLRIIVGFNNFQNFSCPQTRSYCVTVCRHVSLNIYNKESKVTYVEFDEELDYDTERDSMEDEILKRMDAEMAARKIMLLPDTYRDVMELLCINLLTPKQISYMLKLPVETVKKRIQRGRAKLIELLREEALSDESATVK